MSRGLTCRLLVLSYLCLGPLHAYVRLVSSFTAAPLQRRDFLDIRYFLNEQTVPGLRNQNDGLTISSDSSPVEAVEAAMTSWMGIGASEIRFAPLAPTAAAESRGDGRLLISFADTPQNRSIVQGAVAVTLLTSNSRGDLTDTDILFNPALEFSTTLAQGTFDIESTLAHELGHALGLDHSGIVGATMFPVVGRASDSLATLSADEVAFAKDVYPSAGAGLLSAAVVGRVRLTTGQAVRGALVTAIDTSTNVTAGALTNVDGEYRIAQLPPGVYRIYAEPLDGPTKISNLGRAGNGANISFRTDFFGGRLSPRFVTLFAGTSAQADVTVSNGLPALNIEGGGVAALGGIVRSFVGGVVEPNTVFTVEIFGRGLDHPAISESSISFMGAKAELVAGSLQRETIRFTDGSQSPSLVFGVRTAADVPEGLLSISIASDTETAIFSGGLEVRARRPQPVFPAAGVVSAASFLSRPVSPGEIISIFGVNLGPAAGAGAGANPLTGWPRTMAQGVAVLVNDIPAPLFFVGSGQINAQMPFEVGDAASAKIVVRNRQVASPAVTVPVGAVNPGIFTFAFSNAAIVLNQPGGTLNGPGNPAPRGSFVTIFGTGQGLVNPPLLTGQLAGGNGKLSGTAREISVRIGGAPAPVDFTGMAPGFTGLWQVNAQVPAQATPGSAVPLSINVAGAGTQPGVTMAVE
jgi:uncharacterized protein (TIGR03437 family)